MGIRFSKQIKISNFLKLNISKTGVSATVGKKGASINIGGKGTYVNLSPTAVGIKGTGVSYRQKVTGGYKQLFNKITGKKDGKEEKETAEATENQVVQSNQEVIEEYNASLEQIKNLHKLADNVMDKIEFAQFVEKTDSAAMKSLYEEAIKGDEDTIESLVGNFLGNLDLGFDVSANYELEDHILYVDLDLPEIEVLNAEYPVISKKEIAYKKRSSADIKEEYAKLVTSLGVYLACCFFNLSSYITQIVLSAFTTERNSDGDMADKYLYSVKFDRTVFENKDMQEVDNIDAFIQEFENRINMSQAYTFKAIKPFEMETAPVVETAVEKVAEEVNPLIDEAVEGLKEFGYHDEIITEILPELKAMAFQTSGDYLKAGLKLIAAKVQ